MIINSSETVVKIRRDILLPLYWKYIKRLKVLDYYKKLQVHQWNTLKQNRNLQRKKLFKLIKYASQNIPYYKRIIKEYNIQFSEDTIFDDIKKFPILTKEIIRNNFDKLYKFRDNTYYRNTSGGSTGELAIFYQDKYYFAWGLATKILFDEWAGREIGEPMIKLWGELRDIISNNRGFSLKEYLRQQLYGVTILKTYRMNKRDMNDYVQRINKIKPRLILTYINSINELACFIRDNHLSIYSPSAIMTTAGVLFPEVRARITEVFKAPLFNRYGSVEVGDIACNCNKSEGLHVLPSIHYIEILDSHGKEIRFEESGEVIVTILTNYTMPLIRYKIGDRGVLSKTECSCGRGFPLLKKVEGRIRSTLRNKKGELIDSGALIRLFYFRDNIKQFQVIQESIKQITVNLVLKDKNQTKVTEKDFIQISNTIKLVMGNETKIKYNLFDEIKPSPSGKYMYVFSKLEN